ncbi:MAG: O-antigen ligase family protein [Thermogutta sp.]
MKRRKSNLFTGCHLSNIEGCHRFAVFSATALLVTAVCFAPIAFGATEAWSLAILHSLIAVAVGIWIFSGGGTNHWWTFPVLAIALGIVQIVPLPASVVRLLSPHAAEAWRAAAEITGESIPYRLSVAPEETFRACRQLFFMAVAFALITQVTRSRVAARTLAIALGITGLVVVILGLVFWPNRGGPLLGIHSIRWLTGHKTSILPPVHTAAFGRTEWVRVGQVSYLLQYWVAGDGFGPYVISNHYAGCLELTMPFALVIVLSPIFRRPGFWPKLVTIPISILIALVALISVSVGASSRAGTAMLLLGLLYFWWQVSNGILRRVAAAVFAVVGILIPVLFYLSFRGPVSFPAAGEYSAIAAVLDTLSRTIGGAQWRVQQWFVCLKMFCDSPITGFGLGTFGVLYPRYSDALDRAAFAHADHFQLLAETGIFGVAAAALAVTWTIRHLRGFQSHDIWDKFIVVGCLAAMIAFLPHGFVDWNFHVPANALLFAVVWGMLVGITGQDKNANLENRNWCPRNAAQLLLRGLVGLATLIGVWKSVIDWQIDSRLMPLRKAVAMQAIRNRSVSPETKEKELREAFAKSLNFAKEGRLGANAELLGRACLHLSKGEDLTNLYEAEKYYVQAVRALPTKDDLHGTLIELRTTIQLLEFEYRLNESVTASSESSNEVGISKEKQP